MTMNMHAANALNEAKLPTPREEPADAYFSSDGSSSDSDETGMEVSEKPPVPEHGAAVAGMGQKGEQGEGGGLKISRRELEQAGFEAFGWAHAFGAVHEKLKLVEEEIHCLIDAADASPPKDR